VQHHPSGPPSPTTSATSCTPTSSNSAWCSNRGLKNAAVRGGEGRDNTPVTTSAVNVTLREITPANRTAVEALTVTPGQAEYVSSVADSLVEAAETPDACPWYRAVYLDDTAVGFVMISDGITVVNPDYLGPYFLWRLLIDQRHQRRGLGSAALGRVVEYLRGRADARVLLTSVVQGPASPLGFYLRRGFRETGEVHEGELVLALALPGRPPSGQ
jgi:diamine N-acetyltransferase